MYKCNGTHLPLMSYDDQIVLWKQGKTKTTHKDHSDL